MTEAERKEIMSEVGKLRDAFQEFRNTTTAKLAELSGDFTNHLGHHKALADMKVVWGNRLYDIVKTFFTIVVTVTILTIVKTYLARWGL